MTPSGSNTRGVSSWTLSYHSRRDPFTPGHSVKSSAPSAIARPTAGDERSSVAPNNELQRGENGHHRLSRMQISCSGWMMRLAEAPFGFAKEQTDHSLPLPPPPGCRQWWNCPVFLAPPIGVASESEDDEDLRLLLMPGASLGGARPKAAVRDQDGSLAFAKFPKPDDEWDVPVWERIALSLASGAGINTARSRLETVGTRRVLILRRFDREREQTNPIRVRDDAGGRNGPRSTLLSGNCRCHRTLRCRALSADLEELWRRIVFTVLISNRDDHLRNHGFLRFGDGGWRLSPAYDLNPTPAEFGGRTLVTAIDGTDRRASLDLALETAPYYRLSPGTARGIAAEVAAVVSGWRDEASRLGLGRRALDLMASAFEHADLELARRASTPQGRSPTGLGN